jgi:hypothetical protein
MPSFSSNPEQRAAEQKCIDDVEQYGLHIINVHEDAEGPGFAYTVGLFRTYQHPEIILFGLPPQTMHALLNDVADLIRSGSRFEAGATSDEVLRDYLCAFRAVPERHYEAHLGWAVWFYEGRSFPALQLVYPDREHRWPGEASVREAFLAQQPLLETAPVPAWALRDGS